MVRGMTPTIYALAHRASEAMWGSIDGAVHGGINSVVYMRYQCSHKSRKWLLRSGDRRTHGLAAATKFGLHFPESEHDGLQHIN